MPETMAAGRVNRIPIALLADPDDRSRSVYASTLAGYGCRVEETGDGRVALAKALASPPDIVVVDAQLPGLSGGQFTELLRADSATASVPILAVTSDARYVGPME